MRDVASTVHCNKLNCSEHRNPTRPPLHWEFESNDSNLFVARLPKNQPGQMDALLLEFLVYIPGFNNLQYLQSSFISLKLRYLWNSVEILPQAPCASLLVEHVAMACGSYVWPWKSSRSYPSKTCFPSEPFFYGKEQSISSRRVREDFCCSTDLWLPDIGTMVKLRWKTIEAHEFAYWHRHHCKPACCQGLASKRHLLHLYSKCLLL